LRFQSIRPARSSVLGQPFKYPRQTTHYDRAFLNDCGIFLHALSYPDRFFQKAKERRESGEDKREFAELLKRGLGRRSNGAGGPDSTRLRYGVHEEPEAEEEAGLEKGLSISLRPRMKLTLNPHTQNRRVRHWAKEWCSTVTGIDRPSDHTKKR